MSHTKQVRLAGSVLGRYWHVCAFFGSKEEEYQVLLPFIKEGLDQGDRIFQIIDQRRHAEHVQRLEEAGMDVALAQGAERMELRHWDQAYLQDGRFDCQRQLALIEGVLVKGKAKGCPRTRVMGGAEWAMMDLPGVDGFIEYESRLNDLLADHEDPVCCLYDVSKFSASLILDALRVHPAVIIGGVLQENPFYVPPDQFLRELRERRKVERN
jgi:MEDS: MEthanogen/methylotroph, DcmR Sensory domain